ncbi:GNVR domain-containing protein [Maribellus maritimus]|uniref:GNVR domain-containing protein n=1 Tax=Maribellus maritimus TaxID=2870838 RepID=UPI001EEAE196|nr:GNVR domain-containing protein [Maribellus maritimus]MCG6188448.1 hypothetical protein [Maribellus maritimus]
MKDQAEIRYHSRETDIEDDFVELVKTIWQGRKVIVISVVISTFLGLMVALLSPKEFTASVTLVPQTSGNSGNLGGLSSLADMAGFNLNLTNGMAELSPQIYPQIVQSIPFQMEIMNTSYTFPGIDKKMSLYAYYTEVYKPGILVHFKKYTIGLPGVVLKMIREEKDVPLEKKESENSGPLKLTKEQNDVLRIIAQNILLSVNDRDGFMVLSARFFDPDLSAQVAHKTQILLQNSITKIKIEKAVAQLQFVEERYDESKKEFETAQKKLATFRDRNKNVVNAMALAEEEQLQNEYQLAFNVYSQLAQQLEQERIKVKEDTPVFSVVSPAVVPLKKSKPNRLLILVIWIFLGAITGVGWILGREFFNGIRELE